jgi:hypothetical protein
MASTGEHIDPLPGDDRAQSVILYRATCGKCRLLSHLATAMSFGSLRRVPLDAPEADVLRSRHGIPRGKLALIHRDRVTSGRIVTVARSVIVVILGWWLSRFRREGSGVGANEKRRNLDRPPAHECGMRRMDSLPRPRANGSSCPRW